MTIKTLTNVVLDGTLTQLEIVIALEQATKEFPPSENRDNMLSLLGQYRNAMRNTAQNILEELK